MNAPVDDKMLRAALHYAAAGWQVFPCSPNDKHPLLPKETAKGARDGGLWLATTDEEKLRQWWRTRHGAMIGVRMGTGCGAFALDFDPCTDPQTGEVISFEDLLAETEALLGLALPPTLTSLTPRGGRHMLFKAPEGVDLDSIGNSRGVLPKHIDVRGDGGYIIIAPSMRSGPKARADGCEGVAYRWIDAKAEIAVAPTVLIDALRRTGAFAAKAPAASLPMRQNASLPARPPGKADVAREARERYGRSLLARIRDDVSSTSIKRGSAVFRGAAFAGRLVAARAITEREALAALLDASEFNGLVAKDGLAHVEREILNGIAAGAADAAETIQRVEEVEREAEARAARRSSPRPPPVEDYPDMPDDGPEAERLDPFGDAATTVPPTPTSGELPPRDTPREGSGDGRLPPSGGAGGGLDLACARFAMTDLGNAKRFLARFGDEFLFVREWGWLVWDGSRWRREGAEDRLEGAIKATVEAIRSEVEALKHSRENVALREKKGAVVTSADDLLDWAETSQAAGHINCLKGLIQSDLARAPSDFDRDPYRINVLNGVLVIARHDTDPYVQLRPHDRADLITKMAPVMYDPKATCPRFDTFMDEVQPPRADGSRPTQRLLDQWGGLSLTGDASEQKLLFFFGRGRNGKSVWSDTVASIAGDYAETVPIETFVDQGRGRNAGAPTPELAMLSGVRMLRTSEPEKGAKLAEALIKLATGGEPMKVRELNKGYFTLRVQFKMTIQGNYRPKIDGTDEGIWGRVFLLSWPVFIPPERRDKRLIEKLKGEWSGILNRLLAGLCDWMDNGLYVPEEVLEATEAYRNDNDPLGRFLGVATKPSIGKRVQSTELYRVYAAWAKANGEAEWTPTGLGNALRDRGIPSRKSSVVYWLDLELVKSVLDFVDHNDRPISQEDPDPP